FLDCCLVRPLRCLAERRLGRRRGLRGSTRLQIDRRRWRNNRGGSPWRNAGRFPSLPLLALTLPPEHRIERVAIGLTALRRPRLLLGRLARELRQHAVGITEEDVLAVLGLGTLGLALALAAARLLLRAVGTLLALLAGRRLVAG